MKERRDEREEQTSKILEPHQLDPSLMRHACIAAVGYLTGGSTQNQEQMIATLREAVTTPCAGWETFNSLRAELADLRQQLAEAKKENEHLLYGNTKMLSDNIDLSKQLAESKEKNNELARAGASSIIRNAELREQLAAKDAQLTALAAEVERLRSAATKYKTGCAACSAWWALGDKNDPQRMVDVVRTLINEGDAALQPQPKGATHEQ